MRDRVITGCARAGAVSVHAQAQPNIAARGRVTKAEVAVVRRGASDTSAPAARSGAEYGERTPTGARFCSAHPHQRSIMFSAPLADSIEMFVVHI